MVNVNSLVFSSISGITPDGRLVGRSLLYGGKAAECIDIVNRSTLVAALKGNISQPQQELFFSRLGFSSYGPRAKRRV